MKLITAKNKKDYIGLNGGLPWKCSADLRYFKEQTNGCKLLVGRKTFESLPPLKNRELIVVGRGYHTLNEALDLNPDWVIGGASIYAQCAYLCDEWYISIINDYTEGDTLLSLPKLDNPPKVIYNYFEPNK